MFELKKLRQKHDLSCSDMANFLNISKTFYWQIENRKRRLTYDMAIKIAEIFNKTPDKIFYNDFKNKGIF